MWSILRFALAAGIAAGAAACSIRPLPSDLGPGYDTYSIAQRIRCESRDALIEHVADILSGDSRYARYAEPIRNSPASIVTNYTLYPRELREIIDRYKSATIAYSFSFNITEQNNHSASVGLLGLLGPSPVNIGLSHRNDRTRNLERNFNITDQFGLLLGPEQTRICNGNPRMTSNNMYPIAGNIGMKRHIAFFFSMTQSANLQATDENLSTVTDTIAFTTRVSGSASPAVAIAPAGGFQVVAAGGSVEGIREDVHKVIVTIALPRGGKPIGRTVAAERALQINKHREFLQALESLGRTVR